MEKKNQRSRRRLRTVCSGMRFARRGIALALSELVEEQWLGLDAALELTDTIMHENARRIFDIENKTKVLKEVKWT